MATNKNIKCIPFPGIENAYVVISGHKSNSGNGVTKCISFFFDNGDIGAEWEPDNGPITRIIKVNQDAPEAQPHWFYDWHAGQGHWSQLAVEKEGLPRAFLRGDYDLIFSILKDWSR